MFDQNDILLSVKDLEVIYTSGKQIVHAVNGISFQLRRGETLALVGETGAGKTTIAKSILRVLPNPPAKILGGTVTMEGEDLLQKPEKKMLEIRGKKIAMIFQDPMTALNPIMTVGEQIVEGLVLHNSYSKAEAEQHAKEMLELVGIPANRFSEYPFEFSGGMKQRVVIAMALACSPELLLADEPTTALDVTIQAQVLDLICKLREQQNTSMLLITHDLGVVAQTSDTVAVVYAGHIVEYGTKADIFLHPTHPYTKALFGSLPSMNARSRRLHPIAGSVPDPTNLPKGCAFSPRCPHATEACRACQPAVSEVTPGHLCACILAEGGAGNDTAD